MLLEVQDLSEPVRTVDSALRNEKTGQAAMAWPARLLGPQRMEIIPLFA